MTLASPAYHPLKLVVMLQLRATAGQDLGTPRSNPATCISSPVIKGQGKAGPSLPI